MFIKSFKISIIFGLISLTGCSGGGGSGNTDNGSHSVSNNIPLAEDITIVVGTQTLTPAQADILKLHNEKRNIYFHDSNLTYSTKLEALAQEYANILANNGKFIHDIKNNHNNDYGENLYASSENRILTIKDAMYHWFDEEEPLYDYSSGTCQEDYYANGKKIKCGHYTQVVWQDTREVGCATAQYKTGDLKDGYVYVCKYYRSGNTSLNGVPLKPYCLTYDKSDIYTGTIPKTLSLAGRRLPIELVVEDRVKCTRSDNFNSAIEFSNDLKSAVVRDFEIFNNGIYPNTLEFDSIWAKDKTIFMSGINKNVVDEKYNGKPIYMNFTLLGQTDKYYSVELEWNGLDKNNPLYSRRMKAKLYK